MLIKFWTKLAPPQVKLHNLRNVCFEVKLEIKFQFWPIFSEIPCPIDDNKQGLFSYFVFESFYFYVLKIISHKNFKKFFVVWTNTQKAREVVSPPGLIRCYLTLPWLNDKAMFYEAIICFCVSEVTTLCFTFYSYSIIRCFMYKFLFFVTQFKTSRNLFFCIKF